MMTVGYDTAVIGGTMALDSFIRDFKMGGMAKTMRDTTQGNIVSTFQVSFGAYLYSKKKKKKKDIYVCMLTLQGWVLLRCALCFSRR
jgi:hypothetical protein